MAKGTALDVDDASVVRVMEGLRSVLKGATGKETLERVGVAAIAIIKERTREKHRDSMEGPFTPYSAGYAERKGVSRAQVDLQLTGHMFSHLTRQAKSGGVVRLFFDDAFAAAKAMKHHFGLDRMPERRFFAVGEEPAEIILFEKIIFRIARGHIKALQAVFL